MPAPTIKWRVKESPQMSADIFAKYMSSGDKKRLALIQSAHYQPSIPAGYHAPARLTIKEFLASKIRDWAAVADARETLKKRATNPGLHPKMQERLLANADALQSFETGYNKLGIGGFKLEELDPQQPKLKVGKLPISVSLDFLVASVDGKKQPRIGALLFSFTKRPQPQKIQAVARYERLARHTSSLVHMHLAAHFSEMGKPRPKHCLWIDNHLQQPHFAPDDYKSLIGDMEVAAKGIVEDWDAVVPPKGFDPKFAKFVK